MLGVPLYIGTANSFSRASFYVKFPVLPTVQTVLLDLNGGATGYVHVYWDPTNGLVAETSWLGRFLSVRTTPTMPYIQANIWYWVSVGWGGRPGDNRYWELNAKLSGPGGATPGLQTADYFTGAVLSIDSLTFGVGWGVPLSSGYTANPITNGIRMTELCLETENGPTDLYGVRAAPTAAIVAPGSPTSSGIVALYHCDGSVGSNLGVTDATPNHYDLTAATGVNGDQIIFDGPF